MTYQSHLLVLQLHLAFVTVIQTQYTAVKKVCKLDGPQACHTLYNASSTPLTWSAADELCRSYNETLTVVSDVDVQWYVGQLVNNGSNIRAWIAGQVYDSGGSWHTLDRSLYYRDIQLPSEGESNCGYLHLTETVTEIAASLCTDFKTPLCYYLSGTNCLEGFVHIGQVCLRKLTEAVSWYLAESTCNKHGAHLLNYDSPLLKQNLSQLGAGTMWLDVYRYPWQWMQDGRYWQTVKYFNWNRNWGKNIPGQCMYVSDEGGQWRSQSCDQPLDFAICSSDIEVMTATEIAPSSDDNGLQIDRKYLIAIYVIASIICFTVIVSVILCCVVKTSKKAVSEDDSSVAPSSLEPSYISRTLPGSRSNPDQDTGADDRKDISYVYYNNYACPNDDPFGNVDNVNIMFENERNEQTLTAWNERPAQQRADRSFRQSSSPDASVDNFYSKVDRRRKQ